jgi:parallel beta-helix repeat protein
VQNTLSNDTVSGNPYAGIALYNGSAFNVVENCTVTGDGFGIYVCGSNGNTIEGSNISNNSFYGVYMDGSSNSIVTGNTVGNNPYAGVALYNGSDNNTLTYNTVDTNQFGVYVDNSTGNGVYMNNFINNTAQVYDDASNSWDNGTTGNYYSDWSSRDARSVAGGSNVDHYPSTTAFAKP